ncbi:MAG TPA: hypothetical protein VFI96_00185 [Longimicrobiaceae bacterium]|nr:hypothetical protein [Longimicrobiaceae bacterium]
MKELSTGERILTGAAAGLAGTLLMQQIRRLSQQLSVPEPPMREEPGKYMVEHAESTLPGRAREKVPAAAERAAARSLALGYGTTFGLLYGSFRPTAGNWVTGGAALGLATWAAGYVGWLPALGLMPPLTEQEPAQVAVPVVEHVLFGLATAAAYEAFSGVVH